MSFFSDPGGALTSIEQNPVGTMIGTNTAIGFPQAVGNMLNGPGSPNLPAMNPNSQAQVTNSENSLMKTPQQQTAGLLAGTGAGATIANQGAAQQNEQNELGGGGMPGMSDAISAKAAKNFSTSQGRLQQNANFQGAQMANQNMNVAAANAIALQNAQTGVDSSINNLNLQANASRYQTISSLMSGAGAMGGAYAGSKFSPYQSGIANTLNNSEDQFTNPGMNIESTPGSSGTGYMGTSNFGYGAGSASELTMPNLGE